MFCLPVCDPFGMNLRPTFGPRPRGWEPLLSRAIPNLVVNLVLLNSFRFLGEPCDSGATMHKGRLSQQLIHCYYSLTQDVLWSDALSHGSLCSRSVKMLKGWKPFFNTHHFFLLLWSHPTIINNRAVSHQLGFCLFLPCCFLVLLYFSDVSNVHKLLCSRCGLFLSWVVSLGFFFFRNHAHYNGSRASPSFRNPTVGVHFSSSQCCSQSRPPMPGLQCVNNCNLVKSFNICCTVVPKKTTPN